MRRVVITGAGCITAIGNSVEAFSANLFAGVTGIREIENAPPGSLLFSKVARVVDFSPADWLMQSQVQLAERSSQFAIASARQAISSSALTNHYAGEDTAVIFGCSAGGRTAEEPETARLYTQGTRVHPLTVPRAMASAGTSLVCMEHAITGPAYTVSTACASSAHAIGQAFHMVRSGMVKAALAGGHEAPLTYGFMKSWDSLRAVSPTYCRPFAANRDGTTLGEGATIFSLEAMDAALDRGAPILAEIVGFGMSSDATHITQPNPSGSAAAMDRALRDASIKPHEVGYVNAHGTGTEINDRLEAQAIHSVFGEAATTLPISSTKGLHGHAMGASGAIELLAAVLALQKGLLPCAGGISNPDETLGLRCLLRENKVSTTSYALSNSFAFGGLNAVIALKRYLSS
ncbi:beta-ketoacyl-[acyl-carrier-protein] synthase family protein [Terriglobus sp. ADX1]|uniref:beta-ketoacyl-[acyl-carrier-protein] synthase family protein n=1 Tax=Terriglobus sp. ADX1 TaxID=2794063 RepID=UPI002FE5BE8A